MNISSNSGVLQISVSIKVNQTFICPCFVNIILNYNQQDATFLDLFTYFYRCSTCFRRFLRPSSVAHNSTYTFRYCQQILLLAAIVGEMELSSYNQQVATFLDLFIYFYRRSTSFRRSLRSLSGAHNCTYSLRYCQTNTAACWRRG